MGTHVWREAGQPLVSVIVPVYRTEEYIHRCVNSILQQTYKNLEIILIDDGSPDRCGEICDEYKKVDSRVKVIHQENAGLGAARNKGLKHCQGEFVTFVDSDDYIAQELIAMLCSKINDADYVSCGFLRCDSGERIKDVFLPTEEIVLTGKDTLFRHYTGYNAQVKINCVYSWGKLYKKDLWIGLDFPENLLYEDIYIMPYMHLKCKKVKFIPYAGYYYRENLNSITNTANSVHRKKAFRDSFTIWDNHISLYKEQSLDELVVAVECLKIDKIIAQSIADNIPEGMDELIQKVLKKTVGEVYQKSIPLQQKLKYVLFWVVGKKKYKLLRKLVNVKERKAR